MHSGRFFSTFSNFYLGNKASYEKCTRNIFCLKLIIDFEKNFFFRKKVIFFSKIFFSYFQSFLAQKGGIVRKIYKRPFLVEIGQRIPKKIFLGKKCFLFFAKK